ncbi:MAG: CRISPR system precrRNA processing endoribonuclease RAMP protein Cas6 [Candidatus Rokuibacteriota bacterium]
MEWEGLVGTALYEGNLKPFWPYLVFGQWTHVGSGTTFGLGGYRIEDAFPCRGRGDQDRGKAEA